MISSIEKHKIIYIFYLHITKAFDSINHDILSDKLEHYGFRGHVFLRSYLSDRKQDTSIEDTSRVGIDYD